MSNFARHVLGNPNYKHVRIRGVARNTNQKHLRRLSGIDWSRIDLIYQDLAEECSGLCDGADLVIHGACRTFVNRSISDPQAFFKNNVHATLNLLEDARRHSVPRAISISTDEIYGSIEKGAYSEDAPARPSNVYSSSKLASDGLFQSYATTYGLNTLILRFENLYGPYQLEKVFPVFCKALMEGRKCGVYAPGNHVRQWLEISDGCSGILHMLEQDTKPADIFHIAGARELKNLDLARMIVSCFGFVDAPDDHIELIDASTIRAGHDQRYSLDTTKIQATGWQAMVPLEEGIPRTVQWYRDHYLDWLA